DGSKNALTIGTGASVSGDLLSENQGSGTTDLTFNGTGAQSFDDDIEGFASITKADDGEWRFAGTFSEVEMVDVTAGTLVMDGTAADSAFSVRSGSLLKGNGTIGSATIHDGAMLAAGNSIGSMNVVGDLTFQQGSALEVEVNRNKESDLVIAGTANLEGGTVHVLAENRTDDGLTYDPINYYTVLSAAGGVSGTFDAVTDDFAFLDAFLLYDADEVQVELKRNSIQLTEMALTRNQAAAASGIDSVGEGETFDSLLVLSESEAAPAFDAISGEVHASLKTGLIQDAAAMRRIVGGRIAAAFSEAMQPAPDTVRHGGLNFWLTQNGAISSVDGDGNAAAYSQDSHQIFAGVDRVSGTWNAGVALGYGATSLSIPNRFSSGEVDSFHAGAYGGKSVGNFRLNAGLAYSYHDIKTERDAGFRGFGDALNAAYGSDTIQAFGEVSYVKGTPKGIVEPFANLAQVAFRSGRFEEVGGTSAVFGGGTSTNVTYTTLGLRGVVDLPTSTGAASIKAGIGWQYAFGDTLPTSVQHYAAGDPFSVAGVPIASHALMVNTGLELQFSRAAKVDIAYDGQFGVGERQNAMKAHFEYSF
ncbi:autotransporter domain-containing protein, partial [Rhodobacterales bacterium]